MSDTRDEEAAAVAFPLERTDSRARRSSFATRRLDFAAGRAQMRTEMEAENKRWAQAHENSKIAYGRLKGERDDTRSRVAILEVTLAQVRKELGEHGRVFAKTEHRLDTLLSDTEIKGRGAPTPDEGAE